jgi:phosphopantetheine adenylyltransferase
MSIEQFLFMIAAWVVGSIISAVVVGIMTDKFVIKKIMKNEDVNDLIELFREGKEYLRELLENQKKKP